MPPLSLARCGGCHYVYWLYTYAYEQNRHSLTIPLGRLRNDRTAWSAANKMRTHERGRFFQGSIQYMHMRIINNNNCDYACPDVLASSIWTNGRCSYAGAANSFNNRCGGRPTHTWGILAIMTTVCCFEHIINEGHRVCCSWICIFLHYVHRPHRSSIWRFYSGC